MSLHIGNKLFLEREMLLDAVKLAYRKHHLDDESIGWDELSSKLGDALAEVMGDNFFQAWLAAFRADGEGGGMTGTCEHCGSEKAHADRYVCGRRVDGWRGRPPACEKIAELTARIAHLEGEVISLRRRDLPPLQVSLPPE